MKKIGIGCLLLLLPLICFGCQKADTNLVRDNLSEVTHVYFLGQNASDVASISVGRRENPYILDGVHQKTCDFSLIILNLAHQLAENSLPATITVNGQATEIVLDLHPVSHAFMFDLGYALAETDTVSIAYEQTVLSFENVSKDFGVNADRALEIGSQALQAQIKGYSSGNGLNAECYLSVLGEVSGDFTDLFWCFTLQGRDGKAYNCIISAQDGSILAANA